MKTFIQEMKTKNWLYVYRYIQDFSAEQVHDFIDAIKGGVNQDGVFIPGEYEHVPKNAKKALKQWLFEQASTEETEKIGFRLHAR
jgi:hypothetical protein